MNSAKRVQAKNTKHDWRTYGPLKVDWSSWQSKGGSNVAPTINKNGQPLYLAINCLAQKLNATGANGTWRTWSIPIEKFEHALIKDVCTEKKSNKLY